MNELYIKEPWVDRSSGQFLIDMQNELQEKLIEWTGYVVRQFGESPFGYTEWTLSGHLAIAADRAGFFALQEYVAQPPSPQGKKILPRRLRPDLYIRKSYWGDPDDACIFEIKSRNIGLSDKTIPTRISKALIDNWAKLKTYAHTETKYCCALVGMPVFANVNRWDEECGTARRYYLSCNNLFERFDDFVRMLRSQSSGNGVAPNFYWGYFLRHKFAVIEEERGEGFAYEDVAIGMLWVGRIGRSPT
jgi:hypothetical protein